MGRATRLTYPAEWCGCRKSRYAFTPTSSGTLDIATAGSSYDTAVAVCEGSRGNLWQDACDNSQASLQVTAGITYYVRVSAYARRVDPVDPWLAREGLLVLVDPRRELDVALDLHARPPMQRKSPALPGLLSGRRDLNSGPPVRSGHQGANGVVTRNPPGCRLFCLYSCAA